MAGEEEGARGLEEFEVARRLGAHIVPCDLCGKPVYIGTEGNPLLVTVTVFVSGEVSFLPEHEAGFFCTEECAEGWGKKLKEGDPLTTYIAHSWRDKP